MKFTGERYIPNQRDGSDEISDNHLNRYYSISDLVKGACVLDAACGVGYGTQIISKSAKKVYGVDLDPETIDYAVKNYNEENITFEVSSVTKLPYEDDFFDVIISFETIEHIDSESQKSTLNEIKRVLKKDGILIMSTPDKAIYSDARNYVNKYHVKEFYPDEYQRFLNTKFDFVRFFYQRNEYCSIISDNETADLSVIRKQNDDSVKGKYIIALCSNTDIQSLNLSSVQLHTGNYEKSWERIVSLQDEVEVKNAWAHSLNDEIERLRAIISDLNNNSINEPKSYSAINSELLDVGRDLIGVQRELEEVNIKRESILLALQDEKEELIRVNQELHLEKIKNADVTTVNCQLENEIETINDSVIKISEEFSSLQDELNSLEIETDEFKSVNIKLSTDLTSREKEISTKNNEAIVFKEELSILKDSLIQRNNENSQLEDHLAQRGKEYEQLDESSKIKLNYEVKINERLSLLNDKGVQNLIACQNKEIHALLKLKYLDKARSHYFDVTSKLKKTDFFKRKRCTLKFKAETEHYNTLFDTIGSKFLSHFSSPRYLELHFDVKGGIDKGDFEYALEHFILFGRKEVKIGHRKLYAEIDYYNEGKYLEQNEGLTEIAAKSRSFSELVFSHYLNFGVASSIDDKDKSVIENPAVEVDESDKSIEEFEKIIEVPKFEHPKVTIVVPVYNHADYTYSCVKYIVKNTPNVPYEIILMDDNSSEESAINIDDFIKNVSFIRNKENLGFLRNCNKGASLAKGEYILFLNNDTNVQENWLDTLVDLIESDKKIGMVGSRLVYPDGRQQEAGGIIWDDASGWNFGRLADPEMPEFNYVKEVDYVSGASMMIDKSLWKKIGGFDEQFVPAYYEDTDLAFEVRAHGYKVMYQPKSVVIHFEGISNGTDTNSGIKHYQVVNHKKFFTKWKEVLEKDHFKNAQDVFVARDRSKSKPHVLFVDHYLPHYDKDAGSKAASQYLKILVDQGMQVHFIGDNFWNYPGEPYLNALTEQGIEVLCGNWYAQNWQEWLTENGKYFNYVILSRPHISTKYIDLVKKVSDAKIIYFGHDLHFLREEREYEIKKDAVHLENVKKWKDIELDLMRKVDVSYYFSTIEKALIKKLDKKINVNVVPLYIYDQFEKINYNPAERKDIMFVGGFGHGPNSDAVNWFVEEIFPLVKKRLNSIHFYIIGSNPPQSILDLASKDITVTGFVSDKELKSYYDKCKLVVAPLRYGAGVKGKIIDAMYNGVPVITTSIGAEGLSNPETFMGITDHGTDFSNLIIDNYDNESALKKWSRRSNEYCQENFSIDYAQRQMSTVIKEIV